MCSYKVVVVQSNAAPAGSGPPNVGSAVMIDGDAGGSDEVQHITFGGTITGGTFRLADSVGNPTAVINWSSNNATLAGDVQTALIALSAYAPGDLVVTPHADMVGGIGKLVVQYGGAYGAQAVAGTILVHTNGLTGTAPTIAVAEVIPGYASRSAVQCLYFNAVFDGTGTIYGGHFTLAFDGQTTAAIGHSPFNATLCSNIQAALEALSNIPAGGVTVGVGVGGMTNGIGWAQVTFGGALADAPRPLITVASNTLVGTRKRTPLVGVTVVMEKAGVPPSAGVTDAAGLVSLPIYESATGYTLSLSGSGLAGYINAGPYSISNVACGGLVQAVQELAPA